MVYVKSLYRNRFSIRDNNLRNSIWKILCREYFQQFVKEDDTVMDIGAGYCEFINNITARKKIAVDINPDTKKYSNKDVIVLSKNWNQIPPELNGNVNVVFMSNFLEHLPTKEDVLSVLKRGHDLLASGGSILILQPNIDLVSTRYWDFFDHHVVLNGPSLQEALTLSGFKIGKFIKRFLPYTTKDIQFTKIEWLVRLYLRLPEHLRLFAGQSFVIGRKQ